LKLAKMMPCLLLVPAVCNRDPATTVACHSNWGEHGKAKSRRADDCYSAWGCSACHFWLDQGDADAMDKRQIFDAALVRQLEWWERIAEDANRCEPDRRAARWAIAQIQRDTPPDQRLSIVQQTMNPLLTAQAMLRIKKESTGHR
jgi:hypothetical protein